MPVDYSKWDNLELSDDSDIEVHPNVDKRSFIRAKQNQIHLERQQRRHQIETLKYERQINDGLAARIQALLTALRAHETEARQSSNAAGEVAFRAVMESASKGGDNDDQPPTPPAGVHQNAEQPASYTKMMAALLDQVNQELEKKRLEGAARYDAMVAEIAGHADKVAGLQAELLQKLAELEQEEARKITSDSFHTGFDSSHVNKSKDDSGGRGSTGDGKLELLNPNYKGPSGSATTAAIGANAGTNANVNADADADADASSDPKEATPLARQFAAIPAGDHYESRTFIQAHPQILAERHEEGILVLAFEAEMDGHPDTARRCVHQAKLIEYCRSLGRDGVAVFFKRIETREHKAHELFYGDVQETYAKIRTRVQEIKAQQAATSAAGAAAGGVEQIQLHAVEPGTVINIRIPPPVPDTAAAPDGGSGGDTDAEANDAALAEAREARRIFEGFAPDMRRALESGELDKVNEVLGRMPVDEAEALVGQFGEAGILSLEEEIIDATTEEGRAHLQEIGRESVVDEPGVAKTDNAALDKEKYGDPE
ncbi:hsp90 co-chaperone cdc37 [Niveomyces insectorum RCEF 264]|uniref:Hsp90 chaperone protein kinase-targeting subunit n=1 Tax=Niveomyces insectorum RCEF 264 TaxID=1081102 RepID=A0A167R9C8_9HYPO|nr:hsp90 co-chaperone cdc37 [Niveomyces insectorum RCEF 264]